MAHAGGLDAEAEGLGRFAVAEAFEVPHQDHLLVELVELADGLGKTPLQLAPRRGRRRRQLAVRELRG